MIERDKVGLFLDQFNLGASTAENDPLLESAKIETQEFADLYYHDRIDIIKGIKGAGKTALYRLFYFLKDFMIEKKNLHCVFGVEATGDPIFRLFREEFENYSEIEFENFWGVYLIALVYKLIFNTPKLLAKLDEEDIRQIDDMLSKMGIKIEKSGFSLKNIICSILEHIKRIKRLGVEVKVDPTTSQITSFTPTIELEPTNLRDISKRPIYIADFKNLIVTILKKRRVKIWIMLDRLDEVFPHRSAIEHNGLKGLLKTAYNFSNPTLRVKIFLREDIIDYLALSGFTALTHVTDRCSSTMSWSKDDILYLIVKRISAIAFFMRYYDIDMKQVDSDKHYREKIFYQIFPQKIGKTATIDWLYAKCADGNNIVTPRDIIDFFNFAKAEQFKEHKINPQDKQFLLDEDTFKSALEELSKHKKTTFLFAEFSHLKDHIIAFEGSYTEHNRESLKALLGDNWQKIVEELRSIGFIKFVPKSAIYKIPTIWRKGLNIKRGKAYAMTN